MIDGEDGLLRVWDGEVPDVADEIHAWADVHGPMSGRVLLSTERPTAEHLARALLAMAPGEPVGDADAVDALGEVANGAGGGAGKKVTGGDVMALVGDPGAVTLPQVTHERPATDPAALLFLGWRGRVVVTQLWRLPGASGPRRSR